MPKTPHTAGRPARIFPREYVPNLSFATLDGPRWDIAAQREASFVMLVFYRGLHCPACRTQLRTLEAHLDDYLALDINVVALSGDTHERAEQAKLEWEIARTSIGYDVPMAEGQAWGVHVSDSIREAEPDLFFEPALFLVRRDGTLFYSSIQTMSFGRPDLSTLAGTIGRVIERNLPARGQIRPG